MNIAICGLVAEAYQFLGRFEVFLKKEHNIYYLEPEYSGAICLIQDKKKYISKREFFPEQTNSINIEDFLKYEIEYIRTNSKINIRRKIIQLKNNAKILSHFYSFYFKKLDINFILIFNGFKLNGAIAAAVAKNNNIPCFYFEKSLLPFHIQVDLEGVNANNLHRKYLNNYEGEIGEKNLLFYQNLVKSNWRLENPLANVKRLNKLKYYIIEKKYKQFVYDLFKNYLHNKLFENKALKSSSKLTDPSSKVSINYLNNYIFIPLQVRNDSQLLCFNNLVKNNFELVYSVILAAKQVQPNMQIVIKSHPMDNIDKKILKLIKKYPNVILSHSGTIDLIQNASIIVTINSTVGFEALLFKKPVILLGEALYSEIDLVNKISNLKDLPCIINDYLKLELNQDKIERLANAVENILVKCNFTNPTVEELSNLWSYMQSILSYKRE